MLILNKDDLEFVTEFPCLLGHPVPLIHYQFNIQFRTFKNFIALKNWVHNYLKAYHKYLQF